MRNTAALIALFAFACATATAPPPATTPQPAPVAQPAASQPPCTPGHTIVNAVLWVQSSAEYRAAAMQTYANARRALDAALADPNWVGAQEEKNEDPAQPPAIILDADETTLDNSAVEVRFIREGKTYDSKLWEHWVNEAAAEAVPGAKEFLDYAKSKGVTPFYITNRDHPQETEGTRRNLQNLGFPLDANIDTLLLRGMQTDWKSDKSSRRAYVASKYRVLLLLGDDLNDFVNARDKSHAERDAIIDETASWWGTRWFMIPNPMYGSWERPFTSGVTDPCAQMQRKIDALKP
jgi:5'-nucleotidase (lipoprotein e(P4) family)